MLVRLSSSTRCKNELIFFGVDESGKVVETGAQSSYLIWLQTLCRQQDVVNWRRLQSKICHTSCHERGTGLVSCEHPGSFEWITLNKGHDGALLGGVGFSRIGLRVHSLGFIDQG